MDDVDKRIYAIVNGRKIMQVLIRREDKESEELGSTGDKWRCCCYYEDQGTKAIIAKAFFSAKTILFGVWPVT